MTHKENNICRRCGKCCHFYINGKLIKCKNLVKHGTLYSCRIYSSRLGKILYKDEKREVRCIEREDGPYDYEGCPYNTGKPIFGLNNDKRDNQ